LNRGERQHQERRVHARRQARTPGYAPPYPGKTPGKLCSCDSCGNPRRFGDLTIQEIRAAQPDGPETPLDAVYTPGDYCRHGNEPPFCEEWSCLTGEPEELTSAPLRAPQALRGP
jgi:hypothetical protein